MDNETRNDHEARLILAHRSVLRALELRIQQPPYPNVFITTSVTHAGIEIHSFPIPHR